MSGYQQRIQGMDRLLRIRRMRKAVYAALLFVTVVLMYARMQSEGGSLKPFFVPLDGVVEIGLMMGLVGTILGLYLKNLEIQRAQTDSQRYLLSKYSMSRAMTTAILALALGVILLIPLTGAGLASVVTEPARYVSISPGSSETVLFASPDAFGVSYVKTVHVQAASGSIGVLIVKNNGTVASGSVSGSNSLDLSIQPNGWSTNANWSLVFHNIGGSTTASLTYSLTRPHSCRLSSRRSPSFSSSTWPRTSAGGSASGLSGTGRRPRPSMQGPTTRP